MKKIKLFAPILGTIAAAGMILPTVSCGGQQEDEDTYKVSISDGFTISRDHAKEDAEFNADISWTDATKAVNETTIKISVGNQILGSGDYKYTASATDATSGHLKIYKGVINATVVIQLELLSVTEAPIEVINVSDATMGVKVTPSKQTATVGEDIEFDLQWPTANAAYYANLISVFIGGAQIPSASKEDGGYIVRDYTETGAKLLIPGKHIKSNAAITIVVDLETAAYDYPFVADRYYPAYLDMKYGSTTVASYDALIDKNDEGVEVESGGTLEFKIVLDNWDGPKLDWKTKEQREGDNNDDLFMLMGYWDGSGSFNGLNVYASHAGTLYYNGAPLQVEQYHNYDYDFNYIQIVAPKNGWGEKGKRGVITGWYTFEEDWTYNMQVVTGMPCPVAP